MSVLATNTYEEHPAEKNAVLIHGRWIRHASQTYRIMTARPNAPVLNGQVAASLDSEVDDPGATPLGIVRKELREAPAVR
eukprot:3703555-Alexandrium_andersonii.AAC.1